ncbi:TetR/AcrR family transcriptional regulator [Jiangella rhizosphaerae]|uniref:TetR/AcrR family transcriptional regulator n=1 Tax=Jiangella rhizosphaerae TaxID=2293569 RepID=A0A418KLB7_9ACTN|nr:TetR/AcrR family transcriptional regulator [Jiangella rhizosphaerae]RIQ18333.1 TetR/AcrR family transcriptional regulator [Jiangella rhizosphaerae]
MTTRTRRRADAERSIARIVSAARELLGRDPAATIDKIAAAAGVGRMTLYGHFPKRADLVEAALADTLADGERTLSAVDLTGDPRDALDRLLASSWGLMAESSSLLAAAQEVLSPGRVRELHGAPAARLEELIRRGQSEGVFRTDLPIGWLVAAVHYLLKGAAEEERTGRLDVDGLPRLVTASVRSLLTPPA